MKVLLINNFHYRKGGSETVYFNTGRLLEAAGHTVIWFSLQDGKNLPCDQATDFASRGSNILSRLRNYFYNKDVARRLDELLEREKPDIAHVHLIWGGVGTAIFGPLELTHMISRTFKEHEQEIRIILIICCPVC